MPSSQRHAEHVATAAAAAGSDPIGPSEVPPISTESIDAQRKEARRELKRLERALEAAERSLEHARERRAQRIAGAWAELAAAVVDCTAVATEQGDTDTTALSRNVRRVEELLAALDGGETTPHELLDLEVLSAWRSEIDAGTAPLRPEAAELVDQLDQVEAEWSGCGAGDVGEDPVVIAARDHVEECREAVAEVEERGVSGSAGHEARTAIEQAHQRRTAIEEQGRRADPGELAAAIEQEQAALARVGFDSMLDFRIVMSGAGVGELVAKRREVVTAELAEAERALERARDERARHHVELRERRAALRARAVEEFELDPSAPLRDQLRRRLAVPDEVAELSGRIQELAHDAEAAAHSPDDRGSGRNRGDRELTVDDAEAALAEAQQQCEVAREQLAESERTPYLAEDLARSIDELSQSILAGVDRDDDATPNVVLDDPLVDLPVEATVSLLDRIADGDVEVVLVTSRRPLLAALRRPRDGVRVVDGRRRLHRFGRRRSTEVEPTPA